MLAALVRRPAAHPFTALRDELSLSDGSLSVNLSKLEQANLVRVEKTFEGKRPQTLIRITDQGRREFARYVEDLKAIVPGLGAE